MTEQPTPNTTVPVVKHGPVYADLYTVWPAEADTVQTPHNGEAAIENRTDTIGIIPRGRRRLEFSGDPTRIHVRERSSDRRVARVTAAEPDFEIPDLELDEYLTRPADGAGLPTTFERLEQLATAGDLFQRSCQCARACSSAHETNGADMTEHESDNDIQNPTTTPQNQADVTMGVRGR